MYIAYSSGKGSVVRDELERFSFMIDGLEEEKFVKTEINENGEKVFVKLEDEV